jgi:predicted TIM-barrel fold metal-dependent hydrolase
MAHEVLERSMAESTEYKLISADSHVLEPWDLFEKRMPAALKARAPKRVEWNGASAWDVEGGDPIPLPETAGTGSGYRPGNPAEGKGPGDDKVLLALRDPAERIKAQEADSVDAEILYPSTALWDAIKQLDDAELKLACVRAYNDWIAEFCAHSPNRLIGVGKVPTTSVADAVAEARRCVKDMKLRGLLIDAWRRARRRRLRGRPLLGSGQRAERAGDSALRRRRHRRHPAVRRDRTGHAPADGRQRAADGGRWRVRPVPERPCGAGARRRQLGDPLARVQ